MSRHHAVLAALIILAAACSDKTPDTQTAAVSASSPAADSNEIPLHLPEQPFGAISLAASQGGSIAYLFGAGDPPYLTIIGPSGDVVGRAGPRGQGPGELSGTGALVASGDAFLVADNARATVLRFDAQSGTFLEETPYGTSAFVLGAVPDSLDIFDGEAPVRGGTAAIVRVAVATGQGRTLVPADDDVLRSATSSTNPTQRHLIPPAYATRDSTIAWGDGFRYRIQVKNGAAERVTITRDLPANSRGPRTIQLLTEALERAASGQGPGAKENRERLDTLAREVVPHFGLGGIGFDTAGELVVAGPVNDSTFIDRFRGTAFVSRTIVDCFAPGRIAIGGGVVAMHCRARADGDEPYRLRAFRLP
ncbi:MAG TPA: hypothetical protein VFN90_05610 [Gemmatimonadales bacterium]|nr:hypothetical protein [Gemmatimonadales bacterium]